jgi:hypothetical protein
MEAYDFIPDFKVIVPSFDFSAQSISYGEASFKNFGAREVFIDNKPKGEYHIRLYPSKKHDLKSMLYFFKERLCECDVGLIDATNSLNLEYQIYIKTFDILRIDCMMEVLETLDCDLN